mgnify:CR=1 FL=1
MPIAFKKDGKYNHTCKTKARKSSGRSLRVKVTVNENTEWKEDEIIINCAYMDERMKNLVDYVRQFAFSLEGEIDGKFYQLNDPPKMVHRSTYFPDRSPIHVFRHKFF